MKKTMISCVLLLFVLAWWQTLDAAIQKPVEYRNCLDQAEGYEKKEIYYDAIQLYKKALEYSPKDPEIYLKIAEDFLLLRDYSGFEEYCNAAIAMGGENESAIFRLTDYYLENNRREDAIALLKKQIQEKKEKSALKAKLQSLAGAYRVIGGEYEGISDPFEDYIRVKRAGKLGILDSTGSEIIAPKYDAIGFFGSNDFAPVKMENEWYYIDKNDYKRRVPESPYEVMGIANQGIIPAKKDGKWGYLNEDFQEITDFIYEKATPILNGVAAVKQEGMWALVDKRLRPFTEFGFSEVVTDEWGFCSRNGVVFVKTGDSYILLNNEGLQIGDGFYEAAMPFVSEKPAAVKQNGKWGFLSKEGELVLNYTFQNARSFSEIGYAPVIKDNGWGYVKENGDFIIEGGFEAAKAFNKCGIAPVKLDGVWQLIQLDIY